MLDVLKQLGISAEVQPDGTLQLGDGRIVGSALSMPGMPVPGANGASAASLALPTQVSKSPPHAKKKC